MGHNGSGKRTRRERTVYNGQTPVADENGNVVTVRGTRRDVGRQQRNNEGIERTGNYPAASQRRYNKLNNERERSYYNSADIMHEVVSAPNSTKVGDTFGFSTSDLSRSARNRLIELQRRGYIRQVSKSPSGARDNVYRYEVLKKVGKQELKEIDREYYSAFYGGGDYV